MKKQPQPTKNAKFWLVISCIGLAVLWYCFMAICFLGLNALTDAALEMSPGAYDVLLSVGNIAILFIASALTMPFAIWAFKKLKVEAPVLSSLALFMSFVFAAALFAFVNGLGYFQPRIVYVVLGLSALVAFLVYGLIIRPLKHKLSARNFVLLSVGLAVLPLVLYAVHRVWVYSMSV